MLKRTRIIKLSVPIMLLAAFLVSGVYIAGRNSRASTCAVVEGQNVSNTNHNKKMSNVSVVEKNTNDAVIQWDTYGMKGSTDNGVAWPVGTAANGTRARTGPATVDNDGANGQGNDKHYVRIQNLEPDTEYLFYVTSTKGSTCYKSLIVTTEPRKFKTAAATTPGEGDTGEDPEGGTGDGNGDPAAGQGNDGIGAGDSSCILKEGTGAADEVVNVSETTRTKTQIKIKWETPSFSSSHSVIYWPEGHIEQSKIQSSSKPNSIKHSMEISGLEQGKTYKYYISSKLGSTCKKSNNDHEFSTVAQEVITPAPTCRLRASSNRIQKGTQVTLSWETQNAESVEADWTTKTTTEGLGSNDSITPEATADYDLLAKGQGGDTECNSVKVEVVESDPPTCSLGINKTTIIKGTSDSIIVTWSTIGATFVRASWTGPTPVSGSKTFHPQESATYSMVAKGEGGETDCPSVDVIVEEPPVEPSAELPTCSLKSSKDTIASGEEVKISWTSKNATSVRADWTNKVSTSGNVTLVLKEATSYEMEVIGPGGTSYCDYVTVDVIQPEEPTPETPEETPASQVLPKIIPAQTQNQTPQNKKVFSGKIAPESYNPEKFIPNINPKSAARIRSKDGKLLFIIPEGSVTDYSVIVIKRISINDSEVILTKNKKAISSLYEIEIYDTKGDRLSEFKKDVKVAFVVDKTKLKGVDENQIKIASYDGGTLFYKKTSVNLTKSEAVTKLKATDTLFLSGNSDSLGSMFNKIILWKFSLFLPF